MEMKHEKLSNSVYEYPRAASHVLEKQNASLRESVSRLSHELKRYKRTPLMICEVKDLYGDKATIRIPNGNVFLVEVAKECEDLRSGDFVLVEQKNLVVVSKINHQSSFDVEKFVIVENPKVSWKEIGGLGPQINEIREVIELPLKNPRLFKKIGIHPPKGILLHGAPGTGKTLLAKAVATATNATFIEIVSSELVQKYIGEGSKLVKEVFKLARERAPSIIFIDELDALAGKRLEVGASGEREIQRTFMQILSEIDGFGSSAEMKIIACTNRKDILDPSITRPGRLERHIFIPNPSAEGRKEILRIHAEKMNKASLKYPEILKKIGGFTGAEIKAACTEAGYFAIRDSRTSVRTEDFLRAIQKIRRKNQESQEYKKIFG